ncbi:MAG: phage tail tape measure protein [Bacteroidales bacterium]|nr:phage tail tape measure protein [Bacteroidales bacterium]
MAAQSKLQLVLELKNKLFNKRLRETRERVSSATGKMKSKFKAMKNEHIKAFSAMKDQFPMLGRGIELITNKYVLMAAAMAGIGLLMFSATKKAAAFNHEFLHIKQMNLEKPKAEMDAYKKSIKDAAFEVGTDLNDTTKAFYDLQSGTGLFGDKAVEVFKKVGNYSIATGAELNDSMNATVKAMKAMGLGVKDIDGYLASNAKTVQTGITTYAELAKVQTEFLGAASSAGQNVDVANKIFAGFTSIAKNSDTGANMAKTFFQGLKQSAGKFKNVLDIDLYDDKGAMLGADKILESVAQKFQSMSDKEINEAITKIGGPEGLQGMLAKVQTGADDLLDTFKKFDESKFDMGQALENAKGDFNVLSDIVGNRWNVVMTELGEAILPKVAYGLDALNEIIVFARENWEYIAPVLYTVAGGLIGVKVATWLAGGGFKFMFAAISNGIKSIPIIGWILAIIGAIISLVQATEGWREQWENFKQVMDLMWKGMKISWEHFTTSMLDKWMWLQNGIVKGYKWAQNLIGNLSDAQYKKDIAAIEKEDALRKEKIKNLRTQMAVNAELTKKTAAWKLKWKSDKDSEEQVDENGLITSGANGFGGGTGDGSVGDDIEKVVGAGSQVKNITVNIDALNKGGINTQNTTLAHKDANEIQDWFSESMMRVIRNLELST